MSAATYGTRTAVRCRLRMRGLTWLIWRQNRTAFLIGMTVAGIVAVYAAVQHQHATAAVAAQHLDACRGGRASSTECTRDLLAFGKEYQYPLRRVLQAVLLLPFLIGMFLGGPQFAQELESGTYRTVATQSVTRLRWFAAKLGVPLVMTVVISGVIGAALTWWWHPVATVMGPLFPWHMWYPFYGVGPVVVGLSVLLYLLGATLGLFLRRTLAAMGATLVAGGVLVALIECARPHLWPMRTANALHTTEPPAPDTAWLLADGPLSKDGRRVSDVVDCYAQTDFGACLKSHGIIGHWAEYHPASHLWALQCAVTGVCLVLGAVLVALSVWRMRRHSD
ncbi:ABC transporter permease [Streptomyces sp. NPDC052092]|uniref:ABC transporter permease n=1 Tax=Streptomyces sp. NPDC052092 TaxID=3365685 RepID=UPI0037CEF2D3